MERNGKNMVDEYNEMQRKLGMNKGKKNDVVRTPPTQSTPTGRINPRRLV